MSSLSPDAPFAQESLGLARRMWLALIDPQRSFDSLIGRERAYDWLVPALLACAVGIAAHYLTLDLITNVNSPQVQQALQRMDDAQQEQYLQSVQMMRARGWMMVPMGIFTSLVLVSAVLMVIARSFFSAELSFRQALAVKAYGGLAFVPEWIVRTPAVLITGNPNLHLGPGAFLGPDAAGGLLGRVLNGIDVFDIWELWVLTVGLSVMSEISVRKAGIALTSMWLAWVVIGAVLEGVHPAPPPVPVG